MATRTLRLQVRLGRVIGAAPLEYIPVEDQRRFSDGDVVVSIKYLDDSGWKVLTAIPVEDAGRDIELWFVQSDDGSPLATVPNPFVSVKLQIENACVVRIKPENNWLSEEELTQVIGEPDVKAANYLNGLGWVTYNVVSGSNRGEKEIWLKKAD